MLDVPRHGLIAARCGQPDLLPGQRVLTVEPVRPLGVTRVPVHGDADQILRHGLLTRVAQMPPNTCLVNAIAVGQLGLFVLDHQIRPGRRLRIIAGWFVVPPPRFGQVDEGLMHLPPAPDERTPGPKMLVG